MAAAVPAVAPPVVVTAEAVATVTAPDQATAAPATASSDSAAAVPGTEQAASAKDVVSAPASPQRPCEGESSPRAAKATAMTEPAPAPAGDVGEDSGEASDADNKDAESKGGSELAHSDERDAESEGVEAEAVATGSLTAAVPSTGDVVTDSLVAMLNTASVEGLLE